MIARTHTWLGWVMMSCCTSIVYAESQALPVSAVAAISSVQSTNANQTKEISIDPEKDYQEGLKILELASSDMTAAVQAAKRFKLAADAGHAGAQAQFALGLERGQMLDEAIEYYRMSAAQGHKDGQYGLGSIYMSGEGIPVDFVEARRLLALAGAQGHQVAIQTMADAYSRRELSTEEISALTRRQEDIYVRSGLGLDATERQSPEALLWIKRAADINYPPALDALAAAYRTGQFGLVVDTNKADEILAQANKERGVAPPVKRKRSGLYKFLRGDDTEKKPEGSK